MTKADFLSCEGTFTWNFADKFLIETKHGDFVWSSPDYQGDNTVRPWRRPVRDFFYPYFGRCKGTHNIGAYLGDDAESVVWYES